MRLIIMFSVLILTACFELETVIDGTNDHSFQTSVMKIASKMSPPQRKFFFKSLDLIIIHKSGLGYSKDGPGLEAKTFLYGKKTQFIIALGKQISDEIITKKNSIKLFELAKLYKSVPGSYFTLKQLETKRKEFGPDAYIQTDEYKRKHYDEPMAERENIIEEMVKTSTNSEVQQLFKKYNQFIDVISSIVIQKEIIDSVGGIGSVGGKILGRRLKSTEKEYKNVVGGILKLLPYLPTSEMDKAAQEYKSRRLKYLGK